MVRKIADIKSSQEMWPDLEAYRNYALKLGASDAIIIASEDVIVDERVLAKCTYPKCEFYGTNINCPPYSMRPEQTQRVVNEYRYGIFVKVQGPIEAFVGEAIKTPTLGNPYRRKLAEIVAKIESRAFYDGYHLALAFSAGCCKTLYCPELECSGLTIGQSCRNAIIARSSLEAVGIDAYRMAARAGWDIYPLGKTSQLSDAPHGLRLGMVLID